MYEKLLRRAEKLREKAEFLMGTAKELRRLADELDTDPDDINFAAEGLREQADEKEDKAEKYLEQADDLEMQALDLRPDEPIVIDDEPKRKSKNKKPTFDSNQQQLKIVFNTWLEMAQTGNLDAIYEVGNCLYKGVGVDKDVYEALRWYKLAASCGHKAAISQVNDMYLLGESDEMIPLETPKLATSKNKSNSLFTRKKKTPYNGNFASKIDANIVSGIFEDELDDDEDAVNLDFYEYKDD